MKTTIEIIQLEKEIDKLKDENKRLNERLWAYRNAFYFQKIKSRLGDIC